MLAIWDQIGILLSPDLFLSFGVSYGIPPAIMGSNRCPRNFGVWVYGVILSFFGAAWPIGSRGVPWWMDFNAVFRWGYHVRWCRCAYFIWLSRKTQEVLRTLGCLPLPTFDMGHVCGPCANSHLSMFWPTTVPPSVYRNWGWWEWLQFIYPMCSDI